MELDFDVGADGGATTKVNNVLSFAHGRWG